MPLKYSISQATERLNQLGYNAGAASNTQGPMFKAAAVEFQKRNNLTTDGYGMMTEAVLFSGNAIAADPSAPRPAPVVRNSLPDDYIHVGKEAGDIIVESEVTSPAKYIQSYMRPTWPGGSSGVTVAVGIDLGYATAESIAEDWGTRLPAAMVSLMQQCAGATGERAHGLVASGRYSGISIPWPVAIEHFINVELPRWVSKVRKVFPNTQALGPDCEGSLVSVGFNRGLALVDPKGGNSRIEMLNIRNHLRDGHPERVPAEFRSMKRLWVGKNLDGLLARRETEARLFERGLAKLGMV
jgi:peptidoglycan hydrolase-like protein with peptidoglycan-binding domain